MSGKTDRMTEVSTHEAIASAISHCHEEGLSFAVWKLPGQSLFYFAASSLPERIHDINLEDIRPGFLFAPFDPGEKKVFLPADQLFVCGPGETRDIHGHLLESIQAAPRQNHKEEGSPKYHIQRFPASTPSSKDQYLNLVTRCRDAVIQLKFEKIVPSRCKTISLPDNFDIGAFCIKLGKQYPAAMVSVFSSPLTGTWLGASPEMLVKLDAQQHFHTSAVAGTQPYNPGTDLRTITWTQKEIEEQALVERYVISCFKRIRLREFEEHGPRTAIAGNIVHLKTDFEVDMTATRYPQLGSVMLQLLHPTSAVCGMPLEASLAFLKAHEGYQRQFYSGFLGPVHVSQESHLFVNLRCTQLFGKDALLYAGAGVLGDSDPEKEWQETELKMNTLLEVIRQ